MKTANYPTGIDMEVRGKAIYKGHTYYLVRTWEGERDGQRVSRVLLAFRDGSKTFWSDRSATQILSTYQHPRTIRELRAYAEKMKNNNGCPVCAKYCTCDRGFCRHHHDGCEACGAEM